MKRLVILLAGVTAVVAASAPARAEGPGEFAWEDRLNDHLSPYDGRALGPPVSAFGPVYNDGDPRSTMVPRYEYYNGRLIVVGPNGRRRVAPVR